jgi:hypothetical protein
MRGRKFFLGVRPGIYTVTNGCVPPGIDPGQSDTERQAILSMSDKVIYVLLPILIQQ